MKISEIPGADIANLQEKKPICISRIEGINTSYEWFYFEIKNEDSHIVLILSIKDSFCTGERNFKPPSVYLTWHVGHQLIAYSYSIFQNENANVLISQIIRFLNGEDDFLDLWLPDFSEQKYINLRFAVPFLKAQSGADFSKKADFLDSMNSSKKRHFWQYLISAQDVRGSIQTVRVSSGIAEKFISNQKIFCDVYLKKQLRQTPLWRASFSHARTYFDHNFGFEPLYALKDKWYWWHIEDNNHWEVVYFFPKINKSFFHSSVAPYNSINTHHRNDLIFKTKFSFFFVRFPKVVCSKLFGILQFNKLIESAPFYTRISSGEQKILMPEPNQIQKEMYDKTATLEALVPRRIASALNQILMSARQFKITAMIRDSSLLETDLSFAQICKTITRNNGKSFFFASHILSGNDNEKAYFIYTVCRLIDDATDVQGSELSSRGLAAGSSGALFSQMFLDSLWYNKSEFDQNFLNQLKQKLSHCLFICIDNHSTIDFVKTAQHKISELRLEKYLFEEVVSGQAMDENFIQPKDFKGFYDYCFKVAGVVGLIMTKIFKIQNHTNALKAAENMGIAMQITNILRDIKEDFAMGRVYLPMSACKKNDIEFEKKLFLDSSYKIDAKVKIVQEFLEHALFYYHRAIDGIPYITKFRYRFCVRLMCAIYASILKKIFQNHLIVFSERVVVSKFEKIIIFFKVVFGFHPLSAAGIKNTTKVLDRNHTYEEI